MFLRVTAFKPYMQTFCLRDRKKKHFEQTREYCVRVSICPTLVFIAS